jgi:hypothetical protein
MFHKLIMHWYAKWNNLFSLLIYSALMLFLVDYWLQVLPIFFENFSFYSKRIFHSFFHQFGFLLGSSFFICMFFDRRMQEQISTFYGWILVTTGIALTVFFKNPSFAFLSIFFSLFVVNFFTNFKPLKKQNVFHWISLMTPVVFLLMVSLANENSILDYYFFAQPYELLGRWFSILYVGWLIAAWLTYLFDVAIIHSILRDYENHRKQLVLSGRWKHVTAFFDGICWLDLETFKQGIRPQAWVMFTNKPTKPWRLKGGFEPLCLSILSEIDCSGKSSRHLESRFFVGYGPREIPEIGTSGDAEPKQEFKNASQGSIMEAYINEICEENKKRSDNFVHQITTEKLGD